MDRITNKEACYRIRENRLLPQNLRKIKAQMIKHTVKQRGLLKDILGEWSEKKIQQKMIFP